MYYEKFARSYTPENREYIVGDRAYFIPPERRNIRCIRTRPDMTFLVIMKPSFQLPPYKNKKGRMGTKAPFCGNFFLILLS